MDPYERLALAILANAVRDTQNLDQHRQQAAREWLAGSEAEGDPG